MKQIIKDGQNLFSATCSTCGCFFTYELNDISLNQTICPYCGSYVSHKITKQPQQNLFKLNEDYEGWLKKVKSHYGEQEK